MTKDQTALVLGEPQARYTAVEALFDLDFRPAPPVKEGV